MSTIRLTIAQLKSSLYDKQLNLHRIAQTVEDARNNENSDFILFPELYLTGYTLNEKVSELAESLEAESVQTIREIARINETGIIIGMPELYNKHIYNSALFIDKTGEIVDVYRKTHLFDFEKRWFTAGDNYPVINTPFGKIGLMITYDIEFPEVARILSIKGAQLILVLSANMVPYQKHQSIYLRTRAMENHVFVATSNKVGLESDHIFFGESGIVHPTGKIVYQSLNNEDIATVEINLEETKTSKGLLNYLQNRRLDIYENEGLLSKVPKIE